MDFGQLILDLIFQPGSSIRLIPVINLSVLLLIGLLFVLGTYSDVGKIHLYILSFLSLGLLTTVNWFYYEFNKALKEKGLTADTIGSVTNNSVNTTSSSSTTAASTLKED